MSCNIECQVLNQRKEAGHPIMNVLGNVLSKVQNHQGRQDQSTAYL